MFKNLKRQIEAETGAPVIATSSTTYRTLCNETGEVNADKVRDNSGTGCTENVSGAVSPSSRNGFSIDEHSAVVGSPVANGTTSYSSQEAVCSSAELVKTVNSYHTSMTRTTNSFTSRPSEPTFGSTNSLSGKGTSANQSGLQARYDSLEGAYETYRKKTADLLTKKDSHIARLQTRLDTLESRVAQLSGGEQLHSLYAERDSLKDKCDRTEAAYEAEKRDWEMERRESQSKIERLQKELDSMKRDCECATIRLRVEEQSEKLCRLSTENERLVAELEECQQKLESTTEQLQFRQGQVYRFRDDLIQTKRQCIELLEIMEAQESDSGREIGNVKEELDFYEKMDVHNDQRVSDLTHHVHDLVDELEHKHTYVTALSSHLTSKDSTIEQLQQKVKSVENNTERHRDVIEALRDNLDEEKTRSRSLKRERDELMLRNAQLSQEMDVVRSGTRSSSDAQAKHALKQLTIRVNELEQALLERDNVIVAQKQRLHDTRRSHKNGLSEGQLEYMRNVLYRYITSTDQEAQSLVKPVSTLLDLNDTQEKLVRETLDWKQRWLPYSRPATK